VAPGCPIRVELDVVLSPARRLLPTVIRLARRRIHEARGRDRLSSQPKGVQESTIREVFEREEREICAEDGALDVSVKAGKPPPHIESDDIGLACGSQFPSKN
jgi:hypothetical protein